MSSFSQLRDRERQEEEDDADDFDPNNPFYIAPCSQTITRGRRWIKLILFIKTKPLKTLVFFFSLKNFKKHL